MRMSVALRLSRFSGGAVCLRASTMGKPHPLLVSFKMFQKAGVDSAECTLVLGNTVGVSQS